MKTSQNVMILKRDLQIKLPNKVDTKRTFKLKKALESPYYGTLSDMAGPAAYSTRCPRDATNFVVVK